MAVLDRYRRLDARQKTFLWGLVAIAALGWAWRIIFILNWRNGLPLPHNDAEIYHKTANLLARGEGFVDPFFTIDGEPRQAANSPPLYVSWLAIPSVLGQTSFLTHMLWTSLLGAATIPVIGLAGQEVANPRVGLIAAALAAADPQIWWWNGVVFNESMALLMVSVTLLLAYRYWRAPSRRRAAWLGLATGLAALARAELILLFPLIVIPLVLLSRAVVPGRQWRFLGMAAVLAAVPVLPWVAYNLVRFEHPVTLSSGLEVTLASANCDDTYYGPFLGYWSFPCALRIAKEEIGHGLAPQEVRYDQSEEARIFRREAVEYARDNLGRVPVVVLARLGRITQLWNVQQTYALAQIPEGMEEWVARGVVYGFYPLMVLAIVGVYTLRRRRVPVFPLLAVPITVLIVTAIAFANVRYRATAEVPIVLLAAVAADAGLRRVTRAISPRIGAPLRAAPGSKAPGPLDPGTNGTP